jgi:hypothetical protein
MLSVQVDASKYTHPTAVGQLPSLAHVVLHELRTIWWGNRCTMVILLYKDFKVLRALEHLEISNMPYAVLNRSLQRQNPTKTWGLVR